jgi:N12 class adenine-specific DNA methylase
VPNADSADLPIADIPPSVLPIPSGESSKPSERASANPAVAIAGGEKGKARDILAAIRTLKAVEKEQRPATSEEKQALARFCGFGPVALSIFPDPVSGKYKDAGWQALGEQLATLLTPAEYDSAKRTTFNAFYTSPTVITAIHEAIARLGVPANAKILEPGCGTGNFMSYGRPGTRFIGVELDAISGRIAQALHPDQDIRIENFRDTRLPEGRIDAVVGNVPFSDLKLEYQGQRLSLHDYFLARSIDALTPGGVMALVTSHFTLDKQNAAVREYLASKADFVGAIRLPSDAFRREGTAVVSDILFLRKRPAGESPHHVDAEWLGVGPLSIDGVDIPVNRYFLSHPEMVLGTWTRKDTLYGGEGYSVRGEGDLAGRLKDAIHRLPRFSAGPASTIHDEPAPPFVPPPPQRHIGEGSFFVGDDRGIYQSQSGQGVPVVHGGRTLRAYGTTMAKRLAALVGLRDRARRVLQSQNEGWPLSDRDEARRELCRAYDRFDLAYGPINKTTFGETSDGGVIRRMPNLVTFREDPDAMLVMSLEDYDECTGKATKAAIMLRDVVGRTPPVTQVPTAEQGLLVSLDQRGKVDVPFIARLYGKPEEQVIAELRELIFHGPESKSWQTADAYLSGNVRAKLAAAEVAGPAYSRNAEALRGVQPEDVLPGDIDANLGAPWIPADDIEAFAADLFHVEPSAVRVAHLKKDAIWSIASDYAAKASVAATSEYGTERANGTWLLELALNMKTPTIYDTIDHGDGEIRVVNQEATVATHSSFERIGMSREYQEKFLLAQIAEYDELLREHAGASGASRNLMKTIEKQKAARAERLKDLLGEDKKDDGLVFDELGVDHLFIDEAQYFKNLETPTKMERVAGIQTGGSERAFDLYMKARYLGEQHTGHGVTFATGTPISNTMVEMFTMQRFLDPEGLRSRGLEHFDAWAATFGEVVDAMEISPDGASLRPRSRFARFTNLPELQQMFRSFSDVQTAEMLKLPQPGLETGKAIVHACPMSDPQRALQQELVERYERLRSQKVDPRVDNALAITTDGRKLATDARMLSPAAPDFPGSKINRLVETVAAIWQRTAASRGTQMIFCDMGVNATAWGYSVYDDIIRKLVACGIPRDQIAAIGEAESDAKKQALFEKVRNGSVRVLIGSTQKMGTGTNVQRRLVALHHVDAPWKPAEVEQREGRILRQGNDNQEVSIHRYVTEGSFDAYMWQALETKARFISQVMTGENAARRAEDVGGRELSYAEVKAIASGNPAVLTLAEADAELQRLCVVKKNHLDEQFVARRRVRDLPGSIAGMSERLSRLSADQATAQAHGTDAIGIGGRAYPREDIPNIVGGLLDGLPRHVHETTRIPLGTFQGLSFGLVRHPQFPSEVYLEGRAIRQELLSREHQGPRAILNALGRMADSYRFACDGVRQDLAIAQGQLRDYQARLGKPFAHEGYLSELTGLRDQLKVALSGTGQKDSREEGPSISELAGRIKAIRAAQSVETAPQTIRQTHRDYEEPVTARIRRRTQALSPSDRATEPAAGASIQPAGHPPQPAAQNGSTDLASAISAAPHSTTQDCPVRPKASFGERVKSSRRESQPIASRS